jgi:hypothetical protein
MSVKPPQKMNGFDNMALCLFELKLVGGLAFTTIFQKLSNYSKTHKLPIF